MRKSILMTLGLMLGLVGLVSALDRQAEITGASHYKKVSFSTTRTNVVSTGTIIFEGVLVSSSSVASGNPSSIQIWDSTSTTASDGTKICTIYLTTSVVLGGAASFSVGEASIYNFEYKPVTPILLNKAGLHAVNSDVGFDATILYKKFN